MRRKAWLKVWLVVMILLAVGSYAVYWTDWFQKKFVYPLPYQDLVYQYALENNISPYLVAGVILAESKFNPQAKSPKGATGLMQIMPETGQWIVSQIENEYEQVGDLTDPETNIQLGTWYLTSLRKEFSSNEVLMLAAYNGGRGNVKQWMNKYGWTMQFDDIQQIPFRETREYVGKVLHNKQRYEELYGR